MAIMVYQTDDGRTPGTEYMPCGAITPRLGMALKLTAGKLAAAGGADQPGYISMTERKTPCVDGELIPVMRTAGDIVFEAPTPESFTAVPGGRVQLAADGMGLSNTAGGCAEIVYTDSDFTRFRFVPAAATAAAGNSKNEEG